MSRTRLTACLFALAIVAFALIFSINQHQAQRAKQAVLDEDRHVIQQAIHDYTIDKGQPPQWLNDLVDAGYLKALPQDPQNLPTQ
jgi:general secretion pathway protein G